MLCAARIFEPGAGLRRKTGGSRKDEERLKLKCATFRIRELARSANGIGQILGARDLLTAPPSEKGYNIMSDEEKLARIKAALEAAVDGSMYFSAGDVLDDSGVPTDRKTVTIDGTFFLDRLELFGSDKK